MSIYKSKFSPFDSVLSEGFSERDATGQKDKGKHR